MNEDEIRAIWEKIKADLPPGVVRTPEEVKEIRGLDREWELFCKGLDK